MSKSTDTQKVFVSYSHDDSKEVLPLVERLERETGAQFWIDREGIESAEQFVEVIIRAIDQAEIVLFMLSDNSQHSHWTKNEVTYAKNIGKRVVPIVLNGSDLKGWFLFTFGRVNYIDSSEEDQLQRLVKDLRQWLNIGKETAPKLTPATEPEPAPATTPPPAPVPDAPATLGTDGKANDDESNPNVTATDTRESIPEPPPTMLPTPAPGPEPAPTPTPLPWKKTIYAALALLALVLVAVVFVPWSSEDTPQDAVEIPEVVEEVEEEATQTAVEEPVVKAGPVAETGELSVQCTPSGAAVFVDNVKKGKTPCEISGLQPGSHMVKISLSGYETISRTIDVKANGTCEISGVLTELASPTPTASSSASQEVLSGSINVKCGPKGATIKIDGKSAGTSPKTISDLSVGNHTVEVSKSGYESRSWTVAVKANSTVTLSDDLSAEQKQSTDKLVTGTVLDSDRKPLIGALVIIKGSSSGAVTGFDGEFRIRVPDDNATLVISYVDFESLEVSATSDLSAIVLSPSSSAKIGTENGHEWVDLGLSVKWATCNVGASSPEGYGDYYAWGETSTKSSYTEGNCTTWKKKISDISGTSRDVAHVKWGNSWRIPTRAEFEELLNSENCTWEWTTQKGVKGYKVTSRKNGNSIFLPTAGWRVGTSLKYTHPWGGYWSSTPYEGSTQSAYGLDFRGGGNTTCWSSRCHGYTVRPVVE